MRAPLCSPPSARLLPRRMLLLALPAVLPAWCTPGPALAATSQAPPNAEVRRTRQRVDTLQQLATSAVVAQSQADALQALLRRVAAPWQQAQDGAAPALAALEAWRTEALPALADRHGRWLQATSAVEAAVGTHLAAVARVLAAPATARAEAMARLDASVAARQAAEAAERTAFDLLAQAQRAGRQALSLLQQRWRSLAEAVAGSTEALRASAASWAELQQQWQGLRDQTRAAGLDSATLAALPPGGPPWAVPAAWGAPAAPVDTAVQTWQQADARTRQAMQALWMRRDAQAAVQQALTDTACSGKACDAWRSDLEALAGTIGQLQTTLAAARAEQGGAAEAARALAPAAHQQLQAMLAWRDSLAPAVGDAGGPALRNLQAATATGQAALARLARARDEALAAWNTAWRQQYGEDAPPDPELRSVRTASAMPAPAPRASARPVEIGSHALHRLHARDDEPTGFGAYTYVLVGASVRPDTLGVHARLQRLLAEVRNLPVAAQMAADLRARANTFVVPVPPGNRDDSDLVVDLHLAQSLLTHMPPALRLADASRRLLYAENGPFLITLPGRLADARADWPLLFADLSTVPEVAVADVTRRYMADLIGSFNPTTADWSPPAGMQVGIVLVRFVKGTGNVVQALFPSLLGR